MRHSIVSIEVLTERSFNRRREASPRATNEGVPSMFALKYRFNRRREASPRATSFAEANAALATRFNRRREASPRAT